MKKELSLFEQMGGTYTEIEGIFYPNLVVKPEKNVIVGKYGSIWMHYIKEHYPMRYVELSSVGELRQKASEVNEEAMDMLDTIVQAYLKKHKPKNPNSTMEMWQLREQARAIAEESVLEDIVYKFH
ncbi:MAG: TnpV protein [Agathobacter sp.]|nr:TnpV protein [Agathobacter sp.]